jgi:omega-6 fatty acid desaturase (delta-12 desaturase)
LVSGHFEVCPAEFPKSDRQLLDTFVPYLALWILMVFMVQRGYSYWILLALIITASALPVRIFISFHDCCHNSFFASQQANRILGYFSGILIFTPYDNWRRYIQFLAFYQSIRLDVL